MAKYEPAALTSPNWTLIRVTCASRSSPLQPAPEATDAVSRRDTFNAAAPAAPAIIMRARRDRLVGIGADDGHHRHEQRDALEKERRRCE